MNVYDEAHSLAKAIKESQECIEFNKYQEQINSNEQLKKMIDDFQKKSMEVQMKQMAGENVEEAFGEIQRLYAIVMQDPMAANYLQAQMRLSLMMKDVYEILGEATGTI